MYVAYKNEKKRYKGVSLWVYLALIVVVTVVVSFTNPPRTMKVEMTPDQWLKGDKWLNIAKNALSRSELPAKDVSMILDSIGSFQQELYKQLNPQFKTEDSLNKIEKPKAKN